MHLYADGKEHLRDDFCQISVVLTLWSGTRCPCAVDQQANTHSEHISCSSCWKVCDELSAHNITNQRAFNYVSCMPYEYVGFFPFLYFLTFSLIPSFLSI